MGKVAYSQREHSYDNYITQLIRHTIELLKTNNIFNTLTSKIRDEIKFIENATSSYSVFNKTKSIVKVNTTCLL